MGTSLFNKVYRLKTKWYGNPRPEAFEDAMLSYVSGYVDGEDVFKANDPGDVVVWKPEPAAQLAAAQARITGEDIPRSSDDPVSEVVAAAPEAVGQVSTEKNPSEQPFSDQDPNRALMRINLTGLKAHNVDPNAPAR